MEQKDPLITKRAAPLLHKIRDLSLRRGDGGLRDLCRVFRKERIGTEELKSELNAFGVELSGAECTVLFQAYRDAIGYLLTTPFLSDLLATTGSATRDAVNVVFESLAPTVIPLTGLQRKAGYSTARRVVGLAAVLSTAVPSRDPAVVTGRRTVDEADSEFSDIFNARHYPDGQVPEAEFRAYYAAIALQAGQSLSDEALADAIYRHWGVQRNGEGSILASTTNRTLGSTLAPGELSLQLSSMTVGNALPHKSKFVEVRDKIDVPSRVVGYHGHLRTAQEHFGETFHRVEASIPPFRRGNYDEALPTPVDPSYGLVRQGNKANVHNFRFA